MPILGRTEGGVVIIKPGDFFTIHGLVYEVLGPAGSTDFWWLKTIDSHSYYSMSTYSTADLTQLYKDGALKSGKHYAVSGGSDTPHHYHIWERYQGAFKVYDYCNCGAKREIDWRELGDGARTKK